MPRPDRVFVAGGVYHVYNRIGRGEVLGVEGCGLKVRELAATLKKTPDGMLRALARGVRPRAEDERFRLELRKMDREIATESTKPCLAPLRGMPGNFTLEGDRQIRVTPVRHQGGSMVREYKASDLEAVVALFGRSIREIAARDYSPSQVSAWAPEIPDWQGWSMRLSEGAAFVCEREGQIAGFTRIEDEGYLDLLYVHPQFTGRGVARALFERALAWAKSRGISRLTSDVSITARPFFEQLGFRLVESHVVERDGISFQNFRMERSVDAEPRVPADRPQAADR